jgi:uncharacterized protein YchJ
VAGIAGCCARAANGHATAALPTSVMNSPFHSIVLSALAALIEMALPAPSVLDQKDSTPQYDMRLLRCGISTRLMTAVGHSRPAGASGRSRRVGYARESGSKIRALATPPWAIAG